jgi:hypothetical protein
LWNQNSFVTAPAQLFRRLKADEVSFLDTNVIKQRN